MIYEPAEDSFLLEKYVKKLVKKDAYVLDVGTGSGILAKAALEKTKNVLALDINREAVEHCKKQGINAIQSDLFSNIKKGSKFDMIIFNPPYLPEDKREDSESRVITTGGKVGNEIVIRFLKKVKKSIFVSLKNTPAVEFLF